MTDMPNLFSLYRVSSSKDKVRIADGSSSSVASIGSISLTSPLPLSSVFHVPSFKLNLVSVNHTTKVLNFEVLRSSLRIVFFRT